MRLSKQNVGVPLATIFLPRCDQALGIRASQMTGPESTSAGVVFRQSSGNPPLRDDARSRASVRVGTAPRTAEPRPGRQSSLMPAVRMIVPHLAISSFRNALVAAGDAGFGSIPFDVMNSRTSGLLNAL